MEMNRTEYYKYLSHYIAHKMRNFLDMNWIDFYDLKSELFRLVLTAYREGKISYDARRYFNRKIFAYKNTYKEILWFNDSCRRNSVHKFC